jgi:drug/metabolite transporter (DMT)-like permease
LTRPAEDDAARSGGPPVLDLVLLGVAVLAVSTSAPLIRGADGPSLSIAAWRNLLAAPILGAVVLARPVTRREWRHRSPRVRRLTIVAGLLLGAHFATWIPSLSYTSVASSVALVATQPAWAALIARGRGEAVVRATWVGIAIAMSGAVLLSGVDLSISARALFGDLLAMAGGLLAAAYVTVGAEVRKEASTPVYAFGCYGVAGLSLVALCLVTRQPLTGFSTDTWQAIIGLVIGAQLLGHTLMNVVLRSISPTLVSVAILFEIAGATFLAWIFFGETPPPAAFPAAALIIAGVVVVLRSTSYGSDEVSAGLGAAG